MLLLLISFSLCVLNRTVLPQAPTCHIPNESYLGQCIPKISCSAYGAAFITRPLTNGRFNFLRQVQVQCNSYSNQINNEIYVCCPLSGNYRNPNIQLRMDQRRRFRRPITFDSNHGEESPEPSSSSSDEGIKTRFGFPDDDGTSNNRHSLLPLDCGYQIENRIVGGELTDLDEFPWMALLIYNSRHELDGGIGCGGALISERYVLTASHCIMGAKVRDKGGLKHVRLGEYNTEMELDCIDELDDMPPSCADYPLNAEIEETIPHPMYNSSDWNKYHDIALIRLKINVNFTDFIKPICLPSVTDTFQYDIRFHIAGWGKTNIYDSSRGPIYLWSPIKLKLKIPLVNRTECSLAYKSQRLTISENQICAGGERDRDSCGGDSGGPLMHVGQRMRWTVAGVVSFGLTECGTVGVPGVYTDVKNYLPWILNTIRD